MTTNYLIEQLGVKIASTEYWISHIFNTLEFNCDTYVSNLSKDDVWNSILQVKKHKIQISLNQVNDWLNTLDIDINLILFTSKGLQKLGAIAKAKELYLSEGYIGAFEPDDAIIKNNKYELCKIKINVVYDVYEHHIFYEGQLYYKSAVAHELMHAYNYLIESSLGKNNMSKINGWFNDTTNQLSSQNDDVGNIFYLINDIEQYAIINEEYTRFIKFCTSNELLNKLNSLNNNLKREEEIKLVIKTYIKQESSINAESHLSYINYLISFLKTRNGKEITKRVLNGVLDKVSILLHKNVTEKNLNDLPVYLIFKLEGLKRKIIRTFFRYYDLLNNYEEARYSDVKLIESCYSHPFSPLCRV